MRTTEVPGSKYLNSISRYYVFILLGLALLYLALLWHLPLSEDSGYHGYLSKAVAHGTILHKDIPTSTNSIGIYFTAAVFRLFGSSLIVYRTIHAIGYVLVVLLTYLLSSRRLGKQVGMVAALLCWAYVAIPDITLDLGINYILWALVFVLLGFYVATSRIRGRHLLFGVCLGLASLIRETFLLLAVGYIVYELITRLYRLRTSRSGFEYADIAFFSLAFTLTLSINAAILTCYGIWPEYVHDMFASGTAFRYGEGFLSAKRIVENVHHILESNLGHNNLQYYFPLVILSFSSYFVRSTQPLVNYTKYLVIPILLFEAIVVNWSWEYHLVPLFVFGSILAAVSLFELHNVVKNRIPIRILFGLAVTTMFVVNTLLLIPVYKYYVILAGTDKDDQHSVRVADIVNRIPHERLAALSEYAVLFLSNTEYTNRPFIEDLTISANMNRPEVWDQQMSYISSYSPDILVLKSTTDFYYSKEEELGRIIDEDYLVVADFGFDKSYSERFFFRDRVLISRDLLASGYSLMDEQTIALHSLEEYAGYASISGDALISVTTDDPAGISDIVMQTGVSEIHYEDRYMTEPTLYSLVQEGSDYTIVNLGESSASITIRTYVCVI